MRLSTAVQYAFRLLVIPAILSTILLYIYPAVQNCHFPPASNSADGSIAPIRLLALGDPQLEGDTSLPDPNAPKFPSLLGLRHRLSKVPTDVGFKILKSCLVDLVKKDMAKLLWVERKRLDLLGNDYYLAHVYRTTKWWTQPTHVTVLGDLLGSQWINDDEFARRTRRFWSRVFRGAENVPKPITEATKYPDPDNLSYLDDWAVEWLGETDWSNRLINVAGNHDIGYAGDIDEHRIARFEDAFGPVNWRFTLRKHDAGNTDGVALNIVILNSMNLDSPVFNQDLHNATHTFLEAVGEQKTFHDATILLTHVPLYKEAGICVDGPFFTYFNPEHGGGIREQNHLTKVSSDKILETLFSNGSPGIIINGHDHEGCDVWHRRPEVLRPEPFIRKILYDDKTGFESGEIPQENIAEEVPFDPVNPEHCNWTATKYSEYTGSQSIEDGVREITVRSMMGAYGGNAGLLSVWWDHGWKFEYTTCVLGIQHIWWAVHIFDLIVVGLGLLAGLFRLVGKGKTGIVLDKAKKDR